MIVFKKSRIFKGLNQVFHLLYRVFKKTVFRNNFRLYQMKWTQGIVRLWYWVLNSFRFIGKIWPKSNLFGLRDLAESVLPRIVRFRDRWGLDPQYRPVIEGIFLFLIAAMPILNDWIILVPFLFFLGWIKKNPLIFEKNGIFLFGALLILSAGLTTGFGFGNSELIQILQWCLLAGVVGMVVESSLRERMIRLWVISSMFWMAIGLLQQWGKMPIPSGWLMLEQQMVIHTRIFSVFGNPNLFAIYLVSILVFGTCLVDLALKQFWKYVYFTIVILAVICLYFTYTRSAWFIAGLWLACKYWKMLNKWRWVLFLTGFLFLLSLTGFVSRIQPLIQGTDSSLGYRLQIWRGTIKALFDHWRWLWGTGPNGFNAVYPQYQIKNFSSWHAHQFYLQLWLEYGLLGLAGFGILLYRNLRNMTKTQGIRRAIQMVLIAFLAFGLAETWYVHSFIGGYFFLLLGLAGRGKVEKI